MTLIEITVSAGMMMLITLAVSAVMVSTRRAELHIAAASRATDQGRKLSLQIAALVETSRRIFQGDALGQGYLDALDLTRNPLDAGARLPRFEEVRPLGPDLAGEPHTGNILLFVHGSDPVSCVADPSTGKLRDVRLHRFICVYPSVTSRYLDRGGALARDLVIWRSVNYASHADVQGIEDAAERSNVFKDLYARFEVEYTWDEAAPASTAFHAFDASGTLAGTPVDTPVVREDLDLSNGGRLVYRNVQLAASEPSVYIRRAVLTADDPAAWSPDGFEVKIGGLASRRNVWMRLVVESPAETGQGMAPFGATLITAARDE